MGSLLQRLATRFGLLPQGSGRAPAWILPVPTFAPRRGSRAVLLAYEHHGMLQVVANTVAESVATARWSVYKATTPRASRRLKAMAKSVTEPRERAEWRKKEVRGGNVVEVEGHELVQLLEAPSPTFPGREYRKLIQVHLDLVGEAFLWLRKDARGVPVGFEVVPPDCVYMTPTEGNPFFNLTYNTFTGTVHEADMVWLRHLSPSNPLGRGCGRGLALGDELDTSEAIQRALNATFKRGGLPAAVVGVDGGQGDSEDAVEELEKKYLEAFTGPDNAAKVFFASGKVSLSTVQQDFRALQMNETEVGLRGFIRQVWNVPPELVGDLTASNRSTSENAKHVLAEHATLPRLEFLRGWLRLHLVPRVDCEAELDYADPRPREFERVLKAMTAAPNPAFYMNELRRLAGYRADPKLSGVRFMPLPGAQPTQDEQAEPRNPPPPRGPTEER